MSVVTTVEVVNQTIATQQEQTVTSIESTVQTVATVTEFTLTIVSTGFTVEGGSSDHGEQTGLGDDDHPHYHNDARGDARYYTKSALDAGELDSRYYTESEVNVLLSGKFDDPTGDTTQYIAGDGSLVSFPIAGQAGSLVRQVRNETGSTLTKGTVVYISGASGNKALASKAIANSDATSAQTFGVVQADIPTNQNGYVVVRGDLAGINTSAYVDGTQLYLSGSVAGEYTSIKPVAPIHMVYVGVVTRQHVNQGQIEVAIQNGYELDELHDVLITSKSNGDVLRYESASGLWKNGQLSAQAQLLAPANSGDFFTLPVSVAGVVDTNKIMAWPVPNDEFDADDLLGVSVMAVAGTDQIFFTVAEAGRLVGTYTVNYMVS